jgi:hypothetical protein
MISSARERHLKGLTSPVLRRSIEWVISVLRTSRDRKKPGCKLLRVSLAKKPSTAFIIELDVSMK